jgi:predicted RNA binding protein YcfA (HicA-like mRNA interferase family)
VAANERMTQVRDVLRLLADDGWYHLRTVGSYRQLQHSTKPGTVTVAGHPSMDLNPRTYRSILRQAGLEKPND